MQFTEISARMRNRADRLMSGDLDNLAREYRYPLPVHLLSTLVIVRNLDEAVAMLGLLRTAMLDRGVIALQPKVSAVDLPRGGRFRVWVDWHEIALSAEGTRHSSAVYYCKATPNGLLTEMVDYSRLSMPELNPQFAALALSA